MIWLRRLPACASVVGILAGVRPGEVLSGIGRCGCFESSMRFFSVLFILLLAVPAAAQSRRVAQTISVSAADRSVKEMFDEANQYRKLKFEEFEAKKVPVSDRLMRQTEREQKQLAAKLAASAATRDALSAEDTYYLALLYWISENLDNTSETLRKYLANEERAADRSQTSRSLLTVIAAKQKRFDEAAATLAEYLKNEPTKPSTIASPRAATAACVTNTGLRLPSSP